MAVQILLSVVCTFGLFLIFWSTGAVVLSRCKAGMGGTLLNACAGMSLGFGVVGTCVMILCFFHAASPFVLRLFAAILLLVSLPHAWVNRFVLGRCVNSFFRVIGRTHPLVSAAFCALLAGYFLLGLLPPTDFDGLMYHLASAKLFLSHHGFYHIFFNPQSDFPMLTEMNFMLGIAFGNDIICKTTSFCLGAAALSLIAVLCKRHCESESLAVAACVVFMTFTNTIANLSNCYVDVPQALWTILAVLFMERFCETGMRRYAFFAGAFAGMAMQTKIFGVFVLPILLVMLLISMRTKGARKTGSGAAIAFIPAFLLALPWYVKSFMDNGTILSISHATIAGQGLAHPLGVAARTPLVYWLLNVVGRTLSAPWAFSLFPHLHQADTFGPLIIAVLPFLLFVKSPAGVKGLLLYAGLFMVEILAMEMWFVQGGANIRYGTFVLMLCAPLVVWTISRLQDLALTRRMLTVMVVIMVVFGMALFAKRYYKDWKALALNQTREAYYASVLPEYPVIAAINTLHDGATVMAVYNYANYLIDVPYIAAYRSYSSVEETMDDFRAKNIRYIFANDKLDTLANSDPFPQITNKQCVASANGFYLFKVAW